MKHWWQDRTNSEKNILLLAAVVVLFSLCYRLLWAPYSTHLNNYQKKILAHETLITWMVPKIAELKAYQAVVEANTLQPQDFLATINKSIKNRQLDDDLDKIWRDSDGSVKIIFEKVSFDDLINWLIYLKTTYLVNVEKMSLVTNDKIPGTVGVDLTLSL